MTVPMLAVTDVAVRPSARGEAAVEAVSFTLAPGEGLVVSGGPGSGKTSLLRAICGLVRHEGEITVAGHRPGTPEARSRTGYGPSDWPFAGEMRADEVLDLVARLRGVPGQADTLAARVGLSRLGRRATDLPVEDARRLTLACALAADPDLLVLDDPWEFPETERELRAARDRGAAVLVASPDPGGLPALLGRHLPLSEAGA